eukprot:6871301-Pyramimonas_sp.AAC.1
MVKGPLPAWSWFRRSYLLSGLLTYARWLRYLLYRELLGGALLARHAPWHYEFKEGHSVAGVVFIVVLAAQKSIQRWLGFARALADIPKAFDNLSHVRLLLGQGGRGFHHVSALGS